MLPPHYSGLSEKRITPCPPFRDVSPQKPARMLQEKRLTIPADIDDIFSIISDR
jgi:hypothetical protein